MSHPIKAELHIYRKHFMTQNTKTSYVAGQGYKQNKCDKKQLTRLRKMSSEPLALQDE